MKFVTTLILVAASGMCGAAEPSYTKQFSACMSASDGVTDAMLDCIATETRNQDAMLNATYKVALKATRKPRQPRLQEAQRNWLKFRDSNCGFYADPEHGTSADVAAADCALSMTAAREQELRMFTESE
jgi:uncharacterized protein YecT (DUF1311 family)